MRGVLFAILFIGIGFMLAQYMPLNAGERFAVSNTIVDSVQRVPTSSVTVFPDKAVIEVPGMTYARVKSNSMAPFITDKSTVFELPLKPWQVEEEVHIGDLISFHAPRDWDVQGPVLHYVENILSINEQAWYVTRGINQDRDPSPVPAANVIGVVVGTVR